MDGAGGDDRGARSFADRLCVFCEARVGEIHRRDAPLHHLIRAGGNVDEIESRLDEGASDLAIAVDTKPSGEEVISIEARAEEPLRPELGAHRGNDLARKTQPVLEAAAILVLALVGGRRKKGVDQISM